MGPYDVTTALLDGPPGDPAPEWEDIVELTITATSRLAVTEMIDWDPMIVLVEEPGTYRLRVSARGRRAGRDDDEDDTLLDDPDPIEWYLLQVWPAPPPNRR